MHISLEAQPICKNSRTGVGWYTYNIMKNIIRISEADIFDICFFDFLDRNKSEVRLRRIFQNSVNVSLKKCTILPYGLFIRYHELFGNLPYNFIFNSNANIYHFFNFIIPKRIKGKTITTVYDMVYKRYPETMNKVNYNINRKHLYRSCQQADTIITISENSRDEIAEFMNVPRSKIEITSCALDHDLYYPQKNSGLVKAKYGIENDYILYLGTLEPRKNVTSLIKAFHILSQKNKDITLVLAGGKGWQYEEIFALVKDLHLQHRVIFTGYVPEEDVPVLYSCATAFVFPSLYEGFGLPPLEAMACGTPVIVANTSSLPEVVGDAGIYVNPLDIENIAFEMERMINNESLRRECTAKGLKQAQKFTWENSARKVLEIYNKLA